MSREVGLHPKAEKELIELSEEKRKRVDHHIEQFRQKGTDYKYFGLLTVEEENFEMFRIKIMEDKPVEINQRIILDRFHDQWMIWGIEEREHVYKPPYINTIKKRDYSKS